MNSTTTVLHFLDFLADVRRMFNQVHIVSERSAALHSVSTEVFPFKGKSSTHDYGGLTISVYLSAELRSPPDSEHRAIGMSWLLRHTDGVWLSEAEVGWSGRMIGWDHFDSREVQADSIEVIIDKIPPTLEWLCERFKEEVRVLSTQN
jgi:hypothetical protein